MHYDGPAGGWGALRGMASVFGKNGTRLSAGDRHACQGDGEVNLTALEIALEGDFTLVLHKQRRLPRRERWRT